MKTPQVSGSIGRVTIDRLHTPANFDESSARKTAETLRADDPEWTYEVVDMREHNGSYWILVYDEDGDPLGYL